MSPGAEADFLRFLFTSAAIDLTWFARVLDRPDSPVHLRDQADEVDAWMIAAEIESRARLCENCARSVSGPKAREHLATN